MRSRVLNIGFTLLWLSLLHPCSSISSHIAGTASGSMSMAAVDMTSVLGKKHVRRKSTMGGEETDSSSQGISVVKISRSTMATHRSLENNAGDEDNEKYIRFSVLVKPTANITAATLLEGADYCRSLSF